MILDSSQSSPVKRCAIYTRKSTDRGLQKDFNSLKAQHSICQAYIRSQEHRAWVEAYRYYEDPAQSGGTLDRPAMQDLLADVERGLIDVVVVYKLDRLSRSLLDFVRLLDVFDRYGVSFVCITQNFDTADSLGRLVMNVLLTFAQFEREMTGDRIRDKRRAMCARGLWYGGRPPIGYDLVEHRLIINEGEAAIVRQIFQRYLHFRSYTALEKECLAGGVFSKSWITRHGIIIEGTPMRAAGIRKILTNPVYAGYLRGAGELHRGIHEPIISEKLWDDVSKLLKRQERHRAVMAQKDLFDGIIFDCFGRRMRCDRQLKKCGWVAHYRSYQTVWGRNRGVDRVGVDARQAELLVIAAIQAFLRNPERLRPLLLKMGRQEIERTTAKGESASRAFERLTVGQLRSAIRALVVRIEASHECLYVIMRLPELERFLHWDRIGLFRNAVGGRARNTFVLEVPFVRSLRSHREPAVFPARTDGVKVKPNQRLVALLIEARTGQALAEAHRDETEAQLASRMKRDPAFFRRLLKLNYLAPDIIAGIHDGTQPPSLTRKALINANLPLDWDLQRRLFGFPEAARRARQSLHS